jgi:HEPN domain-containing protein
MKTIDAETARAMFARECFRDIADMDYIAARSSFRAELFEPFLVLAGQAVEKTVKGVLLYRGLDTRMRHSLTDGLRALDGYGEIAFRIPQPVRDFVRGLDNFQQNRYLEYGYRVEVDDLPSLDAAIWHLRRYCQSLGVRNTGSTPEFLRRDVDRLHHEYYQRFPSRFSIHGGVLEEILGRNSRDRARQDLVWNNTYYGDRIRRNVRMRFLSKGRNAPHVRYPEVYTHLKDYVHFRPAFVKHVKDRRHN